PGSPDLRWPMTLAGAPLGAPPRLFSARAALSRGHLRRPDQSTLGGGTVVSPGGAPGRPSAGSRALPAGTAPRSIRRTSPEDAPQRAKVAGYILIFPVKSIKS